MSTVDRFNKFIAKILPNSNYDFADKNSCMSAHLSYMLNRTSQIFKYSGLPDSIPERMLELYLQTNGNVCIYKYNDTLYAFTGGLGGEPDVYYMPTIYTIANPALEISKNLQIDKECVVIPSDTLYLGLMPLFARYAKALVENELSMNIASINTRIVSLISAPDDRSFESSKKYLEDIENGKRGVIAENAFLEGIKIQPFATSSNTGTITNLIELEQYLKASWFNELGLNANYNMKRESINSNESQLNDDMLHPLVDDMLQCRQKGLEKVNAMYGTNISVELNSSWKTNEDELQAELENISTNGNSGQPEMEEGNENE